MLLYQYILNKFRYLFIIIVFLSFTSTGQNKKEPSSKVTYLINLSKNKSLDKEKRKSYLFEALKEIENISVDSTRNQQYYKLSYVFFQNRDSLNFRSLNKKGVFLSKKLNDSLILANHYWDLGAFYKRYKRNDSAYYFYNSAKKIFELRNPNDLNVAKLLLYMATIQTNVKDYTGAEIIIAQAIEVFKEFKDYGRLYNCYNLLGIIHNNLEDYEKAIEYHNQALSYIKKVSNKFSIKESRTYNNIGVVYKNLGNHKYALENYQNGLKYDSLYNKSPKLYAILITNLAYSKFHLNDTVELPNLFYKALDIRNELNISEGIILNKIYLAEYYSKQKDTTQSLKFALEAMKQAKENNVFRDLLDSYKLLSKIDPKNDSKYLNEYIQLNDSLVKQERLIRNKFALIKYETDVVKTENKKLSIQNNWILAISSAIVFFSFLIYVITQQRTRNKELEMEQQQQRANEEIYNLMIDQQDKIEEGRKREKERISLELHDGILGRLFGTRLSLGSLNAKDDANSKKTREQYINELQSIEEEVRNISHELGLDNFDTTTSYSTMITNLLEEQSKITNFKYQIEDDNRIVWTDIPGHIKINIYRIIQESVQNINKYAKAQNVILDFKKNNNHIILTIKDDGIGFNQEKRSSGIGLKNMKSRVTLLHGQFTINSVPGKGTSISVDVPMT